MFYLNGIGWDLCNFIQTDELSGKNAGALLFLPTPLRQTYGLS